MSVRVSLTPRINDFYICTILWKNREVFVTKEIFIIHNFFHKLYIARARIM